MEPTEELDSDRGANTTEEGGGDGGSSGTTVCWGDVRDARVPVADRDLTSPGDTMVRSPFSLVGEGLDGPWWSTVPMAPPATQHVGGHYLVSDAHTMEPGWQG